MSRFWRWIGPVSVAISLILVGLRLPDLADGDWDRLRTSAVHQAWLPVLLALVSVGVRSRTSYHVIAAALGGFLTSFWIAHALGTRSEDWLGPDDPWHLVVSTPAIEEVAKLLPLLVVAWSWRKRQTRPGIFDLGLLGTAVGAGFAWHEDAVWGRLSSSGIDGTLGFVAPSFHTDTGFVIGHAGWTGIVGLAVGVAMNLRRIVAWLLPVLALLLVGTDHGWWNGLSISDEEYRWLLVDGAVPAGVLFAGLIAALVADQRARLQVPEEFRFTLGHLLRKTLNGPPKRMLTRWQTGTVLLRTTNMAGRSPIDWDRLADLASTSPPPEGVPA